MTLRPISQDPTRRLTSLVVQMKAKEVFSQTGYALDTYLCRGLAKNPKSETFFEHLSFKTPAVTLVCRQDLMTESSICTLYDPLSGLQFAAV
jgi:hypothetical protein